MATNKRTDRQSDASNPPPASAATPAASDEMIEVEDVRSLKHFFKPEDWWAAAATFLLSGLIFLHYLAPDVTLEDSGELVTGAFTFGVPHPPGYPLWALLGFVWSHWIVNFGNPAWRIGTFSVFTGALLVGIMTLMMTRSTRVLLHTLPWSKTLDERLLHWIALMVGISTSLLFAFNRGVWLWACVSEMRVLNAFTFVLMACTFFAWMIEPRRKGFLYATLLIFGLSMTNHQTVVVMAGALVVGTLSVGLDRFFYQRNRLASPASFTRDFRLMMTNLGTFFELAVAVFFSAAAGFLLFAWLQSPNLGPLFQGPARGPDIWRTVVLVGVPLIWFAGFKLSRGTNWFPKAAALFLSFLLIAFYWQTSLDPLIPVIPAIKPPNYKPPDHLPELKVCLAFFVAGALLLFSGDWVGWIKPRQAFLYTALFLCGCAFYLYMPIAAWTNPPMNWGYAGTKEGFLHAITRGQYEKLQMADPFSSVFVTQIWIFIRGLARQYSAPLCLMGLITLAVATVGLLRNLYKRVWLVYVWIVALPLAMAFVAALRYKLLQLPVTSPWPVLLWGVALATLLCMLIGLWLYLDWPGRSWSIFVWTAFFVTSIGLIMIINPKLDLQEQEITIKFFAPAHGFFAMLIGYGIAMTLAFLVWLGKYLPRTKIYLVSAGSALLAAVPLCLFVLQHAPVGRKWLGAADDRLVRMFGLSPHLDTSSALLSVCAAALAACVLLWWLQRRPRLLVQAVCCTLLLLPLYSFMFNWSLCALRDFDFGYQFGYRMFCPGGGYPDMDQDTVLYGGTDPGRFVPTYMIFCESRVPPKDRFHDRYLGDGGKFDRSDVYIITQNALADNTYMNYIRDHYDVSRPTNNVTMLQRGLGRDHTFPKTPIFIPSPEDSAHAFQQYVDDVQSGRVAAGADVKIENGRVSVTGVGGVMAINGILAKWIFDKNKDKHAFYVEESYVIPWMYPYLRPAGVIMKINKDVLPSPQEDPKLWQDIVAKDKAYWDKLTGDFIGREEFRRNADAKKSFSKMRSAIAGLYVYRGLLSDAEYAFRQSLKLCPESPEGCFRLADLNMNERRFDDARKLMEDYLKVDEYNGNVKGFLNQINDTAANEQRRVELEKTMEKGTADINKVLELMAVYGHMNMQAQLGSLAGRVLQNTNLPAQVYLQVAQTCSDVRRLDLTAEALKRYLQRDPLNSRMWIELGYIQYAMASQSTAHSAGMPQINEALATFRKAVDVGGEPARTLMRTDPRFAPLRQSPQFLNLIQQPALPMNMDLSLP